MKRDEESSNNPKDPTLETIETPVGDSIESTPPKRKRGRPKKSEVASKSRGGRGKVGRPKGDAAIMNEYKARMLSSPKSRQVLDAILNAALDDEHKNQSAAWKLVMDRILPAGMFEQEVSKGNGRNSVNITISGVGGESINIGASSDSSEASDGANDAFDGSYEVKDVN
jgi:hypothetical protein